jgi:hypothetical protein
LNFFGARSSKARSRRLTRISRSVVVVALLAAFLWIAAASAAASDLPGTGGPPPSAEPPPPEPTPDPGPPPPPPPPTDPIPAPPESQPPPPDQAPPNNPPESGNPPSTNPAPSAGPGDSFTQQGSPGGSSDSASAKTLSGADGRSVPGPSTTKSPAIPPGVDNFDDFGGDGSGGSAVQTGGASGCAAVICGPGAGGMLASAASVTKLRQQQHARERDASRAAGLAKAMPPGSPGQMPGRAFSMPVGGGGGGGAAFVLLSLFAILTAALARTDWSTSLRLPTATWRLSGYVPPIESPG